MNSYIPLAFYIVIVSLLCKRNKNLLFFLTFVPLLFFFGTRVEMGVDYEAYLLKYETQHDWSLAEYLFSVIGGKFEPGFFLLIKLLPDFNSLIFVCTALTLIPIVVFFYQFVPKQYYLLAIILYIFSPRIFESFIAMRSGIVIGFFLLAVLLKYRGYLKTAILLLILSSTFHMSGLLLVPVLLLSDKFLIKYSSVLSNGILVLMGIALVVPSFYGTIIVKLTKSVQELQDYGGYVTDTRYGLGFFVFAIFRGIFSIYIISLIRKRIIDDKYLWLAWMTVFCYLFNMVQGVEITYRFVYYFYLLSIPLKCHVLQVDKSPYSKIYVFVSLIYLLYTFITFSQLDQTQMYLWKYDSFLF